MTPPPNWAEIATKPATVYRMFGTSGELLYIGVTVNLAQRTALHRSQSPWWPEVATVTSEDFGDRLDAEVAESLAIRNERPVYNRAQPTADSRLAKGTLTRAVWEEMHPAIWRSAAADLRALLVAEDDRTCGEIADGLGYQWPTEVVGLRTKGRRLRDAARRGDEEAMGRVRRAEQLRTLVTGRTPAAEAAR